MTATAGRPTGMLRVTVVAPFSSLGGSERWLLGLLDTASDRMLADVWLLEDGPLRAELQRRGVPVTVIGTGRRGRDVARTSARLLARLRRTETDVVMANGVKAALAVVPAARLLGVPVAWFKHDYSWDRELGSRLGRLSDLVLAISAGVAEATRRDDVVLVPPPLPAPAAPLDQARAFWTERGVVLDQGPVLAMLTRLVNYKGVDVAVRALAEDDGAAWRLVVAGPIDEKEADEQDRLLRLAVTLGVADRVSFLGEVEDAARHLGAFDAVAVLTRSVGTRFGREGYSMVALEALVAGVPLIGAAGSPEVERMALTAGVVVPPDDHVATARALRELRIPEVIDRCRQGAAEVVAVHPDAAQCADRVVAALAALAGRPGAGLQGPPMTVLSCFKDEEGHVDGVVGGVLAQLRPDDEYVVIEDGSTDKTPAELAVWADQDSRIRVLDGPAVNLSAARNAGFAQATHGRVACTDAGVEPAPGWLDALRVPFAEHDPVDLVVGVFDLDGGDPRRDACRLGLFPAVPEARRRTPLIRVSGRLTGRRFDARRLDGRSMACTVEAWKRAGGFDVALFSSEDAIFGEAVAATGGRSVLALDARVTWLQWETLSEMARTFSRYGEWGGRAGSWSLVRRDVVRGAVYAVAPVVLVKGPAPARWAVTLGAAGYLAVPLGRWRAERGDLRTAALIPAMLAIKDVSKMAGCLRGCVARLRDDRSASPGRDD